MTVVCNYCANPAVLVDGTHTYPHRPDLAHKKFWTCDPCGAYVGCHPPHGKKNQIADKPMGRLANAELRQAKMLAHAAFDPIWKGKSMTRTEAYAWLASALGISPHQTHIGMMDVDRCKAVVSAVETLKCTQSA